MVMPLGPDLAKALGIRVSHLGVIAGSYTLAAAVSGVACSFFVDRLDRRTALFFAMIGLSLGTAAGAAATDFHSLLWARVLAGAFGGPATSVALAMISDVVPHHRRGEALSTVMLSFSLASVLGVPFGLELAQYGTWQWPFFVLSFAGLLVAVFLRGRLPEMKAHLRGVRPTERWIRRQWQLLIQPKVVNAYLLVFALYMSGFLVFPNIAGYVQLNLGFPREHMGRLYLVGGLSSLIVMRIIGKLVDRFGSTSLFVVGSVGFLGALYGGFMGEAPVLSAYGIFAVMMLFGTVRNISSNTLASKVPKPQDRAGFTSLQSAVQHTAAAAGGILSSRLLTTAPSGELEGMSYLVIASTVLVVMSVVAIIRLQKGVERDAY